MSNKTLYALMLGLTLVYVLYPYEFSLVTRLLVLLSKKFFFILVEMIKRWTGR